MDFVEKVFNYEFADEPNYNELRELLVATINEMKQKNE